MEKDVNDTTKGECRIKGTDTQGDPNLCCCYILDEEGNYIDPCDTPVDACCR